MWQSSCSWCKASQITSRELSSLSAQRFSVQKLLFQIKGMNVENVKNVFYVQTMCYVSYMNVLIANNYSRNIFFIFS